LDTNEVALLLEGAALHGELRRMLPALGLRLVR